MILSWNVIIIKKTQIHTEAHMVQKASYSFCDAMLHMKVLGKCASYLSKTILSYMSRTHDFEFLVLAHCNGCAILEILSCHIFYFSFYF